MLFLDSGCLFRIPALPLTGQGKLVNLPAPPLTHLLNGGKVELAAQLLRGLRKVMHVKLVAWHLASPAPWVPSQKLRRWLFFLFFFFFFLLETRFIFSQDAVTPCEGSSPLDPSRQRLVSRNCSVPEAPAAEARALLSESKVAFPSVEAAGLGVLNSGPPELSLSSLRITPARGLQCPLVSSFSSVP